MHYYNRMSGNVVDVGVLKWWVGNSLVYTQWVFSPIGSIKNPVAVTYAYQPRSVVLLSLSDLQMPHLHCLQWSMWSHSHSCHVIGWLCFSYHFSRQRLHSCPSNFLSKTSTVLYTGLITGAQRQSESFNHREHILALHVSLWSWCHCWGCLVVVSFFNLAAEWSLLRQNKWSCTGLHHSKILVKKNKATKTNE